MESLKAVACTAPRRNENNAPAAMPLARTFFPTLDTDVTQSERNLLFSIRLDRSGVHSTCAADGGKI
ncbi:unnamed protein product, partial [Iphiclides podalirius]